jgi:hypothetical protein
MTAAGSGGNEERRSRATRSCPHLGLGRLVEGDRRRRAVCNRGGLGWPRWELGGERGKCLGDVGRGGERCWAIYRRGKAVSRPGSCTWSSCLLVNSGLGSSAGGIHDGESSDATAVLLDKTRQAAMQWRASRDSGRRERVVRGGRRLAVVLSSEMTSRAGGGVLARPCAWKAWRRKRRGRGLVGTRGLARRSVHGDGMARRP